MGFESSRAGFLRLALLHLLLSTMVRIASGTKMCVRQATLAFGRSPSPSSSPSRAYSRSRVATYSSTNRSSVCHHTIADTPLGRHEAGAALLDGLDVYTVPALDDDHPLSVYGIDSEHPVQAAATAHEDPSPAELFPVLLLHGRTWSSVPVYHLLGGNQSKNGQESRSLMETMRDHGLQPYAVDFRGFGGTPPDDAKCVEPLQCVRDAESVLKWIAARHGLHGERHAEMPAVLGWSQGALVAQLLAQKSPMAISKLILYGSLYDPNLRHPRLPLYTTTGHVNDSPTINTLDDVRIFLSRKCCNG